MGEALIADIAARRERIAEDFYEIGLNLQKLSRSQVYRAMGYDSFDALLTGRRLMARVQAFKLITVVEAYPKAIALSLGVEVGYALVRFTAATPAPDVARRLAQSNAMIDGKRVKSMTVADLRNATKRVTAAPRPTDADTRHARGIARTLQAMMRRRGAPSATVRAERQGAKWKLRVELDLDEGEVLGR
ncbi:MAG: hypothetical protein JRH11_09090 [Deltaproteobacteria bacterium]|nr:hypothetical protein [Deltaproteobacteria bacterium]